MDALVRRLRIARASIREYRNLELLSGYFAVLWGFWLMLPWHSFGTETQRIMAQVMPEHWWGALYFLIGATQLWVAANGNKVMRGRVATLAFTAWAVIMVLYAMVNPATPGVPIYFGLASTQLLCSWFASLKD